MNHTSSKMSTTFSPLCMLFSVILSMVIIPGKGDDVLHMCGQLSIDKPTISGRNVTFSFIPDTYSPNASLEWQREYYPDQWTTLVNKYRYIQWKRNVNYYLILTNSDRNYDEASYRVRYANETSLCLMETRKLELEDIVKRCGLVYLKSETVVKNGTVKIEYYPSDFVMKNSGKLKRNWVHSYDKKSEILKMADGRYEETPEQNNKYVLTIHMFSDSMNGQYRVLCGDHVGYTNVVSLTLFAPPSNVTLEVKAVGDSSRQMNAKCTVYGYNPPCNVQIRAPGGIFRPKRSSKTISHDARNFVYEVNLNVSEKDNGKDVTCVVECDKVSVDLTNTVKILLPKPPVIKFNISGSALNISEGERAHVKCEAESVPASNISWIEELSNRNITKNQCDFSPNCVLDIDTDVVSNRHFICQVHYKTKVDHQYLTVHIIEKAEEDKKYDNKQKTTGQTSDKSIIWIILGAGVLLVVIIVIAVLFVVFRKKGQTLDDKRGGRVDHNTQEGNTRCTIQKSEDRPAGNLKQREHALDNGAKENRPEGNLKQSGNRLHDDDEVPIYSQPIKKKTTENPDNIYSQVNKTRKSASSPSSANSSKVEKDGQLLYADLAFDPNAIPSKVAVAKQEESPTEYVDIDYVKTKANKEIDHAPTEQENL